MLRAYVDGGRGMQRWLIAAVARRGSLVLVCLAFLWAAAARADVSQGDYRLAAGDAIRIQVFQNPDLTLDTRVAESGAISYPLIGSVRIGGLSLAGAEAAIAGALQQGGFVQQPQVTIALTQIRGNQVSVLGQVNRPGRYPLETGNPRVSELLATAGGIAATGADTVILVGQREGRPFRREVDLAGLYLEGSGAQDVAVAGGDSLYVHRAPAYYIYGEVQQPGAYRVERGMTVRQALARGGGPTLRGTENRLRIHRRGGDGRIVELAAEMDGPVLADDVLYVRESLF